MKKIFTRKNLGYILVVGAVLYLLYILYKKVRYGSCYMLEEVHETGNKTWVSLIKNDDNGNELRPEAAWIKAGDKFSISNTEANLNGTYEVIQTWIDGDGRIGSIKISTPQNYIFKYDAQQGGNAVDSTYFGIGKICKI